MAGLAELLSSIFGGGGNNQKSGGMGNVGSNIGADLSGGNSVNFDGLGTGTAQVNFPGQTSSLGDTWDYGNMGSTGGAETSAGTGLGWNTQTGQLGLSGLSSLYGLFASNKAMGLAEDQFDFTKKTTNTNLRNQAQSYNTALEDKITARAAMQGNDSAYVSDYLNKNRLSAG